MRSRQTNLGLLVCLLLAFVTGALAYGTGTAWATWIVFAHGAVGLAIVLLAPWKSAIVERGIRRRNPERAVSVMLGVAVVVTVVTGVVHAFGLIERTGLWSPLWVHVAAAVAVVPLAGWHVLARPVRPRRTDLDRRTVLRAGAVVGGAVLARGALEGLVTLTGAPGADRRFTGSHEVGSFAPEQMPVTMWFDDTTPEIDRDEWLIDVRAPAHERTWSYEELAVFDDRLQATLDCTGGWYSTQDWTGVRLPRVIGDDPGGRSVLVHSRTGYARRFPLADAPNLLLATRVGARPLGAGHGAPVRLVAPGRRGFWWVKWVTRVEVSDTPAWLQAPFPLT